ncbi:hypothetical protein JAAARDRAFT_33049 [Jaapia argillacea MUCL 33604]|uniref:Cytochrome b-c1 complex subunit 7 n=1 Tax=Jaapia argillacea MUCL 33604 TaxID=933084 RepID=A0A067PXE0_9AGAM|nr:hypothetical protein JAAARDRAFT_33049 [Jaapia argillacea MUCL 33604]
MFGPLGYSLAPTVRSSRTLHKYLKPVADWYANLAGYRKMGLKYDDLLVEENDEVEKAISRLPAREQYDRAFRFKVASQCSVQHGPLPKEKWLPASEDKRYLKPYVQEAIAEAEERAAWDTMEVSRK